MYIYELVRRCRMTKYTHSFTGPKYKAYFFVIYLQVKSTRVIINFFLYRLQMIHIFGSGDMPFLVKRGSYRSITSETG